MFAAVPVAVAVGRDPPVSYGHAPDIATVTLDGPTGVLAVSLVDACCASPRLLQVDLWLKLLTIQLSPVA
jgi:hypothetical protein